MLFQTFKGRGFDLESTHLRCSKKLSKLLVFVSIAVAICVKFGEVYVKKVQKIKIQKNGYSTRSFFRQGIDVLRRGLKNIKPDFVSLCKEYIEKLIRWIDIQITYSQAVERNLRP